MESEEKRNEEDVEVTVSSHAYHHAYHHGGAFCFRGRNCRTEHRKGCLVDPDGRFLGYHGVP
jgi:hypothetical protein